MLLPGMIVPGSDEVHVQVSNQTLHYLHVIINNQSFLYVPPGRSVSLDPEGQHLAVMAAFYAPGQGVTGQAEQTVEIPDYVASVDCGNGGLVCDEAPGATAGNPFVWSITPDMMLDQP